MTRGSEELARFVSQWEHWRWPKRPKRKLARLLISRNGFWPYNKGDIVFYEEEARADNLDDTERPSTCTVEAPLPKDQWVGGIVTGGTTIGWPMSALEPLDS